MYASAVEDSLAHGDIGPAQGIAHRLSESLEVSATDARRIESDLGLIDDGRVQAAAGSSGRDGSPQVTAGGCGPAW